MHGTMILAHGNPAGGATLGEIVPATIVGLVLMAALAVFGWAHRTGKTKLLVSAGALGERLTGLPPWSAVAAGVTGGSLIIAVFGFYWDVATHIDNGRDAGPFANPAHYWIIVGLAGIALAGVLSILLGATRSDSSVKIRDDWYAPVSGILLLVCGGIAVLGFPLDDVWHRLFGQDVTLWSPTHIQMVGGAAISTLPLWMVVVEGRRAAGSAEAGGRGKGLEMLTAATVLIGLSAFQAEFDYSVPQFRMLYQPALLMLSAGIALVAVRSRLGRGSALITVAFFLGLRGVLSLIVGPVLDHTTLHFPLYIAEALAVEAVAALWGTDRKMSFGMLSGLGIVAVGLPAEWAWSQVWMTIGWRTSLLPEVIVLGLIAGLAGASLGAMIGGSLDAPRSSARIPRAAAILTALGILVVLAYPFPVNADLKGTATVTLDPVANDAGRAIATIELQPADLAKNAEWFNVTSWQGGGSVITEPEEIEEGVYRTTQPIPISGEWKTLIRLQRGDSVIALPIYLPADPGIPAPEVPAEPSITRPFVLDKTIILREAKDVGTGLTSGASIAILLIALAWVAALAWGLLRIRAAVRNRVSAPATS
jgi:hypothetical protein